MVSGHVDHASTCDIIVCSVVATQGHRLLNCLKCKRGPCCGGNHTQAEDDELKVSLPRGLPFHSLALDGCSSSRSSREGFDKG